MPRLGVPLDPLSLASASSPASHWGPPAASAGFSTSSLLAGVVAGIAIAVAWQFIMANKSDVRLSHPASDASFQPAQTKAPPEPDAAPPAHPAPQPPSPPPRALPVVPKAVRQPYAPYCRSPLGCPAGKPPRAPGAKLYRVAPILDKQALCNNLLSKLALASPINKEMELYSGASEAVGSPGSSCSMEDGERDADFVPSLPTFVAKLPGQ